MRFLVFMAAMTLLVSACSSTTVVARDERPNADDSDQAASADSGDESSSDTEGTDSGDGDSGAGESSETDVDRGARDTDTPQTPRELEEAEGYGLGGAEQLESLLTDCEQGSDLACDVLFGISAFESPEEATALSCGGRSEGTNLFCTEGIDSIADELVFDVESEGLPAVVTSCERGDMTACDFLYFRSPTNSTFEDVGATCGNRVEVAVPDCRTFLAE